MGATDQQLAEYFDVDVTTIWAWKNERKEFFNATKLGKDSADYRVERSLYERAVGYSHPDVDIRTVSCGDGVSEVVQTPIIKHYPPDPASMIFWLKNRKPREWRDKIDATVSNPDGSNLIDVMSVKVAQVLAAQMARNEQVIDVKEVNRIQNSIKTEESPISPAANSSDQQQP